ncbi:hypothetical protein [Vibrio phage phiKT1024]|nr:hypothetical protein [Vibrio phage phiKT1024]
MSLNYISLSANILSTYNSQKDNRIQDNLEQVPYPAPVGTEWMDNFIIHYDNDANNGVFSSPSVIMKSDPEILRFNNNGQVCGGTDMMASRIASYWESQLTFGTPQYSSITSITNDASKIKQPIEDYLCSYPGGSESSPYYEHLFLFIESQVKTIIWTVTENGQPPYTVSIS